MENREIGQYIKGLGAKWKMERPGKRMIDLYKELGITKQHWYNVCNGSSVGRLTIRRFAEFFCVSEASIMTGGESEKISTAQLARVKKILQALGVYEETLEEPLSSDDRTMLVGALLRMNVETIEDSVQILKELRPAQTNS